MENFIKKLLAAFGIDSENLKKSVSHFESTRKEYYKQKEEEEIRRASDEIKAANEKQKE